MRKSALIWFGLVVAALVALGLVVLASASGANGVRQFNDTYYFFKRQLVFLALGIGIAAALACFDYRHWRNHPSLTWFLYGVVFVLLIAVFGFRAVKGSHRWLALGPVHVQPAEFAKLMVVFIISMWLDRAGWRMELFMRGALWPSVIIGGLALPILFEPDFGSVMVVGLAGMLVMFVAGVRFLHLLGLFILLVLVVGYNVLTNANRMARMAAFFGVKFNIGAEVLESAAQNAADQARSSLVAIANGGINGVGLNQSMQKHYYLPEAHTDFIFAIGAEELGLKFTVAVIVLFVLFLLLSIYIARHASDRFGRYLTVGMAFIVFFQAMFNLGVVCEALPTKGMALPFFSYGGSNLLCAFAAVGTILSVGIHSQRELPWNRSRSGPTRSRP